MAAVMRMVAEEAAEASAAEVVALALFSMAAAAADSVRPRLSEAAEGFALRRLFAVEDFTPRVSMAAVADTGVDIAITIAAAAIMAARPIMTTDRLIITRAGAASSGPITGRAVSAMSDIGITAIIVPITATIITTATTTISDSGLAGEAG